MTDSKPVNPTQLQILQAAEDHVLNHGFRGMRMEELASMAGVSKKTIYTYFPSKSAILEQVLRRKFHDIYVQLEEIRRAHEGNTAECLVAVLMNWQRIMSRISPVFFHDIQEDARFFLNVTHVHRHKIIRGIFGRIIADGIKAGDFRPDIKPELIAEIIIATAEGLIQSNKLDEFGLLPKEMLVLLIKLYVEGSLTEQGRNRWNASNLKGYANEQG